MYVPREPPALTWAAYAQWRLDHDPPPRLDHRADLRGIARGEPSRYALVRRLQAHESWPGRERFDAAPRGIGTATAPASCLSGAARAAA